MSSTVNPTKPAGEKPAEAARPSAPLQPGRPSRLGSLAPYNNAATPGSSPANVQSASTPRPALPAGFPLPPAHLPPPAGVSPDGKFSKPTEPTTTVSWRFGPYMISYQALSSQAGRNRPKPAAETKKTVSDRHARRPKRPGKDDEASGTDPKVAGSAILEAKVLKEGSAQRKRKRDDLPAGPTISVPTADTASDDKSSKTPPFARRRVRSERPRPHQCTICGKAFGHTSHLINHMRIHTGEKPFACEHCNKRFNQASHLKVHIRTHTGERPFRCHVCGKDFNVGGHLRTHFRRYHRDDLPHKCNACGSQFESRSELKSHGCPNGGPNPVTPSSTTPTSTPTTTTTMTTHGPEKVVQATAIE